jgi:hypothetical protein
MTDITVHERLRLPSYQVAAKSQIQSTKFWKAQKGLIALTPEEEARYRRVIEAELARLVRLASEFTKQTAVQA